MPCRKNVFGWIAAVIAAAMVLAKAAIAGATDNDLSAFVTTYHCTVSELLTRIHLHKGPSDRYLILWPIDRPEDYVQCLFDPHDRQMLCEAASGWWLTDNKAPRIRLGNRSAIAKLGYSMNDSHGNFGRNLEFHGEPDIGGIADLMLETLYSGYGARLSDTIKAEAPYALRKGMLPKGRCVPVS